MTNNLVSFCKKIYSDICVEKNLLQSVVPFYATGNKCCFSLDFSAKSKSCYFLINNKKIRVSDHAQVSGGIPNVDLIFSQTNEYAVKAAILEMAS